MSRVTLTLPDHFQFATEIPVRISDINYGGHLGNDSLLSILHESRVRFFRSLGFSEKDVGGVGIIMADAVIVYRSESFHGDLLRVEIAIADLQNAGCDILYRVTNATTDKEVARAKTGIVFFDYSAKKVSPIPATFRSRAKPSI